MKTRIVIGSLMATMMAFQVMAQRVENDDMYFNSKDREKLKSESPTSSNNDKIDSDYNTFRKKHFDKNEAETQTAGESVNPTDSYSARTINPEYIARSNSEQASEDEQNYYVEGYVPANTYDSYSANDYSSTNNNNWDYNNSYYGSNYGYGSPYNSLYSPYYGSCNPWMSPYYGGGSGLTISMAYMMGSPGWNYGMSYGYGYNPYSNYPSYYSPYYGGGYPSSNYYGDASQPNYGKRPSRHSAIVTPTPRSSERVSSNTSSDGSSNGRTGRPVDDYYVKPFKRTSTIDRYINSSTEKSRERYSRPSSTDYPASRTRESYNSSRDTRSSSPSFSTPSRNSSSGASRSSGGSSAPRKRD